MSAASPMLGMDAAAVVARALAAPDTASVVRSLRAADGVDPARLAGTLVEQAQARLRRDPRLAFWLARLAVRSAERSGEETAAAGAQNLAGQALVNQGRVRGGLRLIDRALRRFAAADMPTHVADVQVRRMQPLIQLGRYDEARAAGDAARRTFLEHGEAQRLMDVESALGDLEYRLDHAREALDHYRRAKTYIPDARRATRAVAVLDCNSAICLESLSRYRAAARYFERARAIFEREGLRQAVAFVDYNRAYFAFLRGRYAEALALYARAEQTFRDLGDARQLGRINLERAEMHLQMGMPAEARDLARSAAERLARDGLAKESAQALFFAAVAELLEGRAEVAEEAFLAARERFEAEGNSVWVAECDLVRAHALAATPNTPHAVLLARRLARSAHRAFLAAGRAERAASAEILLARLDLEGGRAAPSLTRLERTQERTRRIQAPWMRVDLDRFRGLALLALGRRDEAIEALLRAIGTLESHRGGVPADEFMVSFLASKASLYAEAVGALCAAGRVEEAFDVGERARSRALVDMLSSRGSRVGDAQPSRDLRHAKLQRAREELNAVYARLHRLGIGAEETTEARASELRRVAASKEAEIASMLRDGWSRDPEFASLTTVGSIGLARVRDALGPETTLIEYFVTRERLHVFVVTRDGFVARTLPVPEGEIARRVQRLRFHLAKWNLGEEAAARGSELWLRAAKANLAELHDLLVAPVRDALRTRRLVVVPHGVLHGVPFHALANGAGAGDGWLADQFAISCVPSASVYAFCAGKRARATGPATVLALPDEAAPRIADEAAAVAKALGPDTRVHVGATATSSCLREAARTSSVLHIASHAAFHRDRPALSRVRLADTWLNVYDTYALDVRSDLVVLSACETGVADVARGDEALGLVRGFLYAGAPRLLVSLWRVNDRSAAVFMETFHGACRDGRTWDGAFGRAVRAVRERFPHPYHWAAFALVGHTAGRAGAMTEVGPGAAVADATAAPGPCAAAKVTKPPRHGTAKPARRDAGVGEDS